MRDLAGTYRNASAAVGAQGRRTRPGRHRARLAFHEISDYAIGPGTYGSYFYVTGTRNEPRLYYWVGDPDNCAEMSGFTRQPRA
ncbi:hypothetical protein GCM10010254_62600 [Streptomyces chromofuscus]|nr:hypothetical protein GCM10010254_62600 [Streptomyces chromofuscus]